MTRWNMWKCLRSYSRNRRSYILGPSLSDDPEAKLMKENIIKSAKQLGFPSDVDLGYVFSNMSAIIDSMKKSIREGS